MMVVCPLSICKFIQQELLFAEQGKRAILLWYDERAKCLNENYLRKLAFILGSKDFAKVQTFFETESI